MAGGRQLEERAAPPTSEALKQRAQPGLALRERQHDEQVRRSDEQVGLARQYPAPQGARVGEVEASGESIAEGTERIPHERGNPAAELERPLTKAWSVRLTALGVTAWTGIDPAIVNADPVTLLVVLAGAVLVQQLEGRRGGVVENEESVPAILALHGALTHDEGADGPGDVGDPSGRLGDLDLLGLGPDIAPRLLVGSEDRARQSLPGFDVPAAANEASRLVRASQRS